jgi:hypothetical protein
MTLVSSAMMRTRRRKRTSPQQSSLPVVSPSLRPRRLKSNPFKNPMTFPLERDIIKDWKRGQGLQPKIIAEHILAKKTMNS